MNYYFDSLNGNDTANGTSPETAWKSLDNLRFLKPAPGDTILFKRGGLWRGAFSLFSGTNDAPVTVTNYGEGPLPIIEGSVSAELEADWTSIGDNLWKTAQPAFANVQTLEEVTVRQGHWSISTSGDAVAESSCEGDDDAFITFSATIAKASPISDDIKIWGPYFNDFSGWLSLRFRARASRKLQLPPVTLVASDNAEQIYAEGPFDCPVTTEWQEFTLILRRIGASKPSAPLQLCMKAAKSFQDGDTIEWQLLGAGTGDIISGNRLSRDIGNIIFEHGEKPCARKRWSIDKLEKDFDFVYCADLHAVIMKAPANPATLFKSIELAQHTGYVIGHGGIHDAVVDGLAVRYGAAHGFGGGSSKNITIRNCDIYYIGGAHQFTRPDGVPVRYGNGIEFWGNCDGNLVENNRIWEIYDAALTNQGRDDTETNVTYRNNIIWNSEFSFEYWNKKRTDNILFENNTCVDAGYGWAHFHRPDPNGAHLMFYSNRAETSNFVVKNNIFVNTTEQGMRMDYVWMDTITLKHNLWFTGEKPVYRFRPGDPENKRLVYMADMKDVTAEFHQDEDSLFAQPVFVNPDEHDYRLADSSAGYGMGFGAC